MISKALAWAFDQELHNPSQKLVLLVLAKHSDKAGSCFPSVGTISRITGQRYETVQNALRILEARDFIQDTGETAGPTRQVKIWRLLIPGITLETSPPNRGGTSPPKHGGTSPRNRGGTSPRNQGGTSPRNQGGNGTKFAITSPPNRGGPPPQTGEVQPPPQTGDKLGTQKDTRVPGYKAKKTRRTKAETEEKAKKLSKAPGMREFTDAWCKAFREHHGQPYKFSARDGIAASELLKLSMPRGRILSLARSAWANPSGFYSKQAATLHGFARVFNEITGELGKAASTDYSKGF